MMSENRKAATRDQLLSTLCRRRYKTVTLPNAQLPVRIQSLNEREWSSYLAMMQPQTVNNAVRVEPLAAIAANRRLIAMSLVDDNGARLLTDAESALVAEWDARDVDYLAGCCSDLSGIIGVETEFIAKNLP